MATSEKEFGAELWVVLVFYLLLLFAILAYSALKLRRAAENENSEGAFVDHYLAGRDLGPIVLGFSLCASMFSGYTVVGLPAEAYSKGFSAWRWVGSCTIVSIVYLTYAPRLRFLAQERHYDSVLSYVHDRFGGAQQKKDPLHWIMVVVVLVPCFIYLCAQFDAFANTINSISNGAISPLAGAIFLAALLVGYEILGGLRAVTLTDVIQGSVLLVGSLSVLVFVDTHFEGLPAITSELERISPKHVQVMDASQGLSWAEFWIGVGVQRALFPDYLQRAMAARSQNSLRIGNVVLALSPFLIQVPLLLFGIIGRVHHPGLKNAKQVFSLVVLDIVDYDAVGKIFGSVMMAASVAAIMSTADSVLIVVSHIVTLDIIRPLQDSPCAEGSPIGDSEQPRSAGAGATASPRLVFASRVVTLCAAFVCIPIVLSDFDLSFLIQFQSAILMQTAPTFILSLYWKGLHRWASIAGLVTGVPLGIGLVGNKVEGGILISFGANIVVTLMTAFLFPRAAEPLNEKHQATLQFVSWRPPSKHGECLRKEPVSSNWWQLLAAAILCWFALPFYRSAGHIDPYLSGSPLWAVTAIMVLLAVHLLIVYIIAFNWEDSPGEEGKDKIVEEQVPSKADKLGEPADLATSLQEIRSEIQGLKAAVKQNSGAAESKNSQETPSQITALHGEISDLRNDVRCMAKMLEKAAHSVQL